MDLEIKKMEIAIDTEKSNFPLYYVSNIYTNTFFKSKQEAIKNYSQLNSISSLVYLTPPSKIISKIINYKIERENEFTGSEK